MMTAYSWRAIWRIGFAVLFALLMVAAATSIVHGASATYGYDAKGRVSSITYDDGTVVEYSYDANGNRTGATKTTPPPDTSPPTAPGNPTFTNITMTSATANWTVASDNRGVIGYDYRINSGAWQTLGNVMTVPLTGLSAATSYTVSVRARDAASNLGPSSSGSFTTPDTAAPSVPTGLSASAPNSSTVNLSWSASSDNVAVTGYRVYRGGVHIGDTAATPRTFSDGGRTGSTTYSYQVSARDAAANYSALSSAVSVTTPDTIAPSAPTSLSASAVSPSQINLSWGGSSDTGGSGLAGYRVYRNGSHIANTGSTSYPDGGLAANTTYSYFIIAYDNASNTSAQSNTASATTWPPVSATVSATAWRWFRRNNNTPQIDPPIVVTPSGGSGTGYTYAWEYVSGDTQTSVISPTSSSTRWSRTMDATEAWHKSYWRCRVTDSAGNVGYTVTIEVNFIRTWIS
jgi:YD repeat-containing protein